MAGKVREDGTIIHFVGGNNEKRIGQNSSIVQHTENGHTSRIMFDLGSLFPPEWTGLDAIIPDVRKYFAHTENNKEVLPEEPIDAMFISHCHEDHIGGLIHLARAGFKFPKIYTSPYTAEIIKIALKEANIPTDYFDMETVEMGEKVTIADNMEVHPFNVSHSTVGALGYYVKTTLNERLCSGIINPGDYRLGESLIGPGFDEEQFAEFLKDKPVTHVLLDSTSTDGSDDFLVTFEEAVANTLEQINEHSEKQVISAVISRSLQNLVIDLEVAKQSGRKVFLDGYWVKLAYMALQKTGFHKYDDVVYGSEDLLHSYASLYLQKYPPHERYIIPSGAFAESAKGHKSGLYKMSMQQKVTKSEKGKVKGKGPTGHPDFTIDNNTLILARQRCIEDINGTQVRAMYQRLAALGATVIENLSSNPIGRFKAVLMQRTGHAVKSETKKFIQMISKYRKNTSKVFFIPFHGNREQLNSTAKTIVEAGAEPAICYNADSIKVSAGKTKKLNESDDKQINYISVREDSFAGYGQKLSTFFYSLVDEYYNKVADLFEIRPEQKTELFERNYDNFDVEELDEMPTSESFKKRKSHIVKRGKNVGHLLKQPKTPEQVAKDIERKKRNAEKRKKGEDKNIFREIADIFRSKKR